VERVLREGECVESTKLGRVCESTKRGRVCGEN
jgi:hypothetical protein